MRTRAAAALVALLVLVGAAACGDEAADGGTDPTIVFGSGEVPPTIPEDFPVPDGAVIGSSLIDEINTRTEFELRVGREQAEVAQFFTVNLVNSGYVVDDSRLDNTRWTIDFRRDTLRGSIMITVPTAGVSQVVVEMNVA